MPLTFDLQTLTWLKTRLSLWVTQSRSLLGLILLAAVYGCVPAIRFEEAQSAAQVELEGRRRAEHEVSQLKAQAEELTRLLQQQTSTIGQHEEALAQADLDTTTQGKQREDAEGLVQQLQGELARVGGHLRSFSDDKQKLEASREAEAARGRAVSRVTRDLALMLSEPLGTGEYTLDPEQGKVLLRVPRDKLLADDGSVKPQAEPLLKAVARVLQLHAALRLAVEGSASSDPLSTSRLLAALRERGAPGDRLVSLASAPNVAGANDPNTDVPVASDAPALVPEGPAAGGPRTDFVLALSVP